MVNVKNFFSLFFTNKIFKKLLSYIILIIFIYVSQDFLGLFLLTFIFAYVFLSISEYLKLKIDVIIDKSVKKQINNKIFKKIFCINVIVVFLYLFFITNIIFILSDMLPKLINELSEVTKSIPFLSDQVKSVTNALSEIKQNYNEIWWTISEVMTQKNYEVFIDYLPKLKSVSAIFFHVLLALILSFVFIIDRRKLKKYFWWLKDSNFKFMYEEYKHILIKIRDSFWIILRAQWLIALVNTILTVLWLLIIGYIYTDWFFPYILTFWLVVFIFGFIPVLWVFISSIPIIIISYNFVWWLPSVFMIIVLITIIHAIEAYYLNPKIVSNYLKLPVSFTFIILIISEHIFWFAWLLIWVSLFYFFLWLLKDADKLIGKTRRKTKKPEA